MYAIVPVGLAQAMCRACAGSREGVKFRCGPSGENGGRSELKIHREQPRASSLTLGIRGPISNRTAEQQRCPA